MPHPLRTLLAVSLLTVPASLAAAPAETPPPPPAKHAATPHHAEPAKPAAKATPVVRAPATPPAHKPVAAAHKPAAPHHAAAPKTPAPPPVAETPAAEPAPAAAAEPAKGTATGLPLPRFAALRSDDVNFRAGPGTRYPIDWIYKRRDLPVEIEREFETWRLVRDPDGTKGWVHQATLTGRRTFVVGAAEQTLRDAGRDDGAPVAHLMPGVIGRVRACAAAAAWCEVQVGDYRGWIRRADIWGVNPTEAIN